MSLFKTLTFYDPDTELVVAEYKVNTSIDLASIDPDDFDMKFTVMDIIGRDYTEISQGMYLEKVVYNLKDVIAMLEAKEVPWEIYLSDQSNVPVRIYGSGNPWILTVDSSQDSSIVQTGTPTSINLNQSATEVKIVSYYNPNLSYENFDWITVEYEASSTFALLALYVWGVSDINESFAISDSGTLTIADQVYKYRHQVLIHDNPNLGDPCVNVGFGIFDFNTGAYILDAQNISFVVSKIPHPDNGFGLNFETGLWTEMGAPTTSSEHANHTVTWDNVGQRLKCVATGAGESYFTWAFIKGSSDDVTGYVTISDATAAGAKVVACIQLGAENLSLFQTGNGTKVNQSLSLSNPATEVGIKIITTGAGDVYVDRIAYASTQRATDIT